MTSTTRYACRVSSTKNPVDAWREMNALHAAVQTALDREMRTQHGLSAVEYEVLERLTHCDSQKCRIQELSDFLQVGQSTASRVVARLEEEGLATRAMCTDDRRGIFATATAQGCEKVAKAEATYRAVLEAKLNPSA